MSETALISALQIILGGVLLKLAEGWLTRGKSRDDELTVFRAELRAENAKLRTDLSDCQGQLALARADVRELTRQVEQLRGELARRP